MTSSAVLKQQPIPPADIPLPGRVSFFLNGDLVTLDQPNPAMTLLNWLRYERGLVGTKEGCAEGDCGACTVVVAALDGGGTIGYRAVNACILFLPTLHGKMLFTVEALKTQDRDNSLHPIQRAMADLGGSQCGFCTPGFVMSLYGHHLGGGDTGRETLKDLIAGNLCRCTGYGPILDAGAAVAPPEDAERQTLDQMRIDLLRSINNAATLEIEHTDPIQSITRRYYAPTSIDDLADLMLEWPDATLLAGSTDVGLWVTKQDRILDTVIYLGRVTGLSTISETDDSITIGAGVTYTEAFDTLASYWPDYGEVMRRLGSVQIRNAGTIGGNIANGSPIGDSMPLLIALGATLVLRMADMEREIPLEDYFIDYGKQDRAPGEFVAAINVPKPAQNQHFRAYKISKRFDQDISALCMGFGLMVKNGVIAKPRLAFGGMAATPKRAAACEAALAGHPLDASTLARTKTALSEDFQPISDMRASADYRLRAAQNLLERAFLELQENAPLTRVTGGGAGRIYAAEASDA